MYVPFSPKILTGVLKGKGASKKTSLSTEKIEGQKGEVCQKKT